MPWPSNVLLSDTHNTALAVQECLPPWLLQTTVTDCPIHRSTYMGSESLKSWLSSAYWKCLIKLKCFSWYKSSHPLNYIVEQVKQKNKYWLLIPDSTKEMLQKRRSLVYCLTCSMLSAHRIIIANGRGFFPQSEPHFPCWYTNEIFLQLKMYNVLQYSWRGAVLSVNPSQWIWMWKSLFSPFFISQDGSCHTKANEPD